MFEVKIIKTPKGAEITVCEPHEMELCHYCCMDFVDMNNEARADASKAHAASKHEDGDSLEAGQFRVGTEVRMPDHSGRKPPKPLDGRIAAVMEETDPESDFSGESCYVIRLRDNTYMTYPVDWVHDEWLVQIDGKYIAASKVFQILSDF